MPLVWGNVPFGEVPVSSAFRSQAQANLGRKKLVARLAKHQDPEDKDHDYEVKQESDCATSDTHLSVSRSGQSWRFANGLKCLTARNESDNPHDQPQAWKDREQPKVVGE